MLTAESNRNPQWSQVEKGDEVNSMGNILTASGVGKKKKDFSFPKREMLVENLHCHLPLASTKLNFSFENQTLLCAFLHSLFSLPALLAEHYVH